MELIAQSFLSTSARNKRASRNCLFEHWEHFLSLCLTTLLTTLLLLSDLNKKHNLQEGFFLTERTCIFNIFALLPIWDILRGNPLFSHLFWNVWYNIWSLKNDFRSFWVPIFLSIHSSPFVPSCMNENESATIPIPTSHKIKYDGSTGRGRTRRE